MGRHCAAFGCSNSDRKLNENLSFHCFPINDPETLKQWYAKIKRVGFTATNHSRICSEHFNEEDFEYQPFTNRRQLKKGVIPSIFSYTKPKVKRAKTSYCFSASVVEPQREAGPSSCDKEVQTELSTEDIDALFLKIKKLEDNISEIEAWSDN
ncbi:THAP domain-containing protein 1 [Biomphalaria glabrata]|nr:THAP domain-containing protein 1 [Biomphalaria glabrata]